VGLIGVSFGFAKHMGTTSLKHAGLRTFGPFAFRPDSGELARNGFRIRLQPQPALVLVLLTDQPGKLISREEIYRAVWGEDTHVDFEQSLNYCVRQIRSALRDDADHPTYLETVPKRGYRFLCPVAIAASAGNGLIAEGIDASTLDSSDESVTIKPEPGATRWNNARAGFLICAVFVVVAVGAILWRNHRLRVLSLHASDTIVLDDFANSTGDAVFDDALKTALNLSLRQSPFLKVMPESEVAATLQLMTRAADTRLTPQVAGELCQRAGSKAYIAGAIASLGSEYVLELKAVNCQNGDTLAQEQITAASKEKVLNALGEAASRLRRELGESLATVQKFDVPLEQATTSSLDALKAYSLGGRVENEQGTVPSLPYYQRAIALDPNFAMGYFAVAGDYITLAQHERAAEYFTKAFQLREHTSLRERFLITGAYYEYVTGELDKASHTFQEGVESYAHDEGAYGDLGVLLAEQGQYENAAEIAARGVRLVPKGVGSYANLSIFRVGSQRFDQAQQAIRDAQAQKLDEYLLHEVRYVLGFLGSDHAAMAEQQLWFAGKPDYENWGFALASDTEAYAGHLGKARELTRRAVESAVRVDNAEGAAIFQTDAAQREAAFGDPRESRREATEALKLAPTSLGVESEAAQAFALAGDATRAESLAQDLGKRFPLDTQVQSLWLPAILAQVALDRKKPFLALNRLQDSSFPIEFGLIQYSLNISCLYPAYVRGEAYLAAGQGSAAAVEFQKILDHSGMVWNCWTGALAHLGVARANALEARTSLGAEAHAARARALAGYQNFLTLWKDADPDIPILKQAKTEYARLQ
jgi:eukaryotic-like serine/threonine-protein kinase